MTTAVQSIGRYEAIAAPQHLYAWRGFQIAYYVDGDGPPLLLIHSINAAASAFEMRGPFFGLRKYYRVFALDLLGYGGSDRPARRYSADDYVALIADFARDVVGLGNPVIATSLGAAYVIRAAAIEPGLFGPLVLVAPVGIKQLAKPAAPGFVYKVLRGKVGDAAFRLLSSNSSTRFFLGQQVYYDTKNIDRLTLAGYHDSAQQPGAKYAPICFLSMLLNCDVGEDVRYITQPVLLVWGQQSSTTPPALADEFLRRLPNARLEIFDHAKLLVQDEHPAQFNALVREFLGEHAGLSLREQVS